MIKHTFAPALVAALALCVIPSAMADDPTDHLTVTQWVQPSTPGVFQAKVVVPRGRGKTAIVQNALVRLNGPRNTVHRGVTDEKGNVVIKGVAPGGYALTVRARGLVGWQAMHVASPGQVAEGTLPDTATISPALVSTEQFETMILPYLNQEYTIDSLSIVDDEWGRPTSVSALADHLVKLADLMIAGSEPVPPLLHLGPPNPASRYDWANRIFTESARLGGPAPALSRVGADAFPTPARRPRGLILDVSLADSLMRPMPPWGAYSEAAVADLI